MDQGFLGAFVPSYLKDLVSVLPASHYQLRRNNGEWIFDPALDPVMVGGGAGTNPLLEFDLQPIGARRNWRNAVNKQRYEATLRQQRDSTPTDNIGQELTHALQRSIQRQIANVSQN